MMDKKDFELLLTLYNEGTITKTAQKLYMTQPAVTYRIIQLEQKFNIKIIIRGNKGVIFTPEGEFLVERSRVMLKELNNIQDSLQNMSGMIQGKIKLGVSNIFAFYKLPRMLEGFLTKYPNVEIELTTGWSSDNLKLFHSEDIHIAVVRGEHNWQGENIVLDNESICIASKNEISLDDLPHLNFISYQTDLQLKNTFENWWKDTFTVPPKISMHVDRMETSKELVKRGLGFSIFPSICLQESDALKTIDLETNGKPLSRTTSLLFRNEHRELKVLNAFIQFVRDYYNIS